MHVFVYATTHNFLKDWRWIGKAAYHVTIIDSLKLIIVHASFTIMSMEFWLFSNLLSALTVIVPFRYVNLAFSAPISRSTCTLKQVICLSFSICNGFSWDVFRKNVGMFRIAPFDAIRSRTSKPLSASITSLVSRMSRKPLSYVI